MEKLIRQVKDTIQGKLNGSQRSGHWHLARMHWLATHPNCALCGGKDKLEVHHIRPFHTHPELELDPNNFITLCESKKHGVNCHEFFGHLGNFKNINEDVVVDTTAWAVRLQAKLNKI